MERPCLPLPCHAFIQGLLESLPAAGGAGGLLRVFGLDLRGNEITFPSAVVFLSALIDWFPFFLSYWTFGGGGQNVVCVSL